MGKFYDAIEGLKWSAGAFADWELIKWTTISMVASFVVAFFGIILLAATLFAVPARSVFGVALLLAEVVVLAVLLVAAMAYVTPRTIAAALKVNRITPAQKLPGVVETTVFLFRQLFINLFCWYDKRLLAPAAILAVVTLGTLAVASTHGNGFGGKELNLAVLGAFSLMMVAWMIAIVIHSIRTGFAPYFFVRGDADGAESIRRSYQLVNGQTWEVFLANFWSMLPAMAVLYFGQFCFSLLGTIPVMGGMIESILNLMLQIVFSAFVLVLQTNICKFYEGAKSGAARAAPVSSERATVKKTAKKSHKK